MSGRNSANGTKWQIYRNTGEKMRNLSALCRRGIISINSGTAFCSFLYSYHASDRGFMKRLKVFFSWCIDEKLIMDSPLADFEMPTEKYGTPYFLSLPNRSTMMQSKSYLKRLASQEMSHI